MKFNAFLKTSLLFFVLSGIWVCRGQSDTQVGISAGLQGSQVDILLPITTYKYSIAPAFGMIAAEGGGTEFHLGIVPRAYLSNRKATPYVGGRFGLLIFTPKGGDSIVDYLLGFSCGGEYYLDTHFSLGVEAQMNLTISNENSSRFGNPGNMNLNTATAVFMTFYF